MTALLQPYIPPTAPYVVPEAEMLAALTGLAATSALRVDLFATRVSSVASGTVAQDDLSGSLVTGSSDDSPAQISRDCTQEVAGLSRFTIAQRLQWGFDQVQLLLGISSREYKGGQVQQFPVGVYVVTTPGRQAIERAGRYPVTGYDRCYLLQESPTDSYAFAAGSTYLAAVTTVFRGAGIIGATDPLSLVCNYPGDWAVKTLPAPQNYPLGDGNSQTNLQIVNDLLDQSGCIAVYTDRYGQFTITSTPVASTQPIKYTLDGNAADGIVRWSGTSYTGDVAGVTNRWIFIRTGLTFQPVEGSGQYTVNNTTTAPSDQNTVGRVIPQVVPINASSQADLKTQGDRYVQDALQQIEKLSIAVMAWPLAWHYDVALFKHTNLPNNPTRRVQVQQWVLTVSSDPTTLTAEVVGVS